jgi:mycothiol synthase
VHRADFPGTFDSHHYAFRAFEDRDYEALARLRMRNNPRSSPHTAEELRHLDASFAGPEFLSIAIVAEDPGSHEVVGWGKLAQLPEGFHPDKYWVYILVDPDHRNRGIGSSLYSWTLDEARSRGGAALWASVTDDAGPGLRFFQKRGFVALQRTRRSRLDLSKARIVPARERVAALEAAGVRFTTLAEEGPDRSVVRERYYRLHRISSADEPHLGEHVPLTFEQFVRLEFGAPAFLPAGTFLARQGEEYVAVTSIAPVLRAPDTVQVGYTGTLPAWRGRGLATELKRRSIDYARAAGFRWMTTGNDYANLPIVSINDRFGFEIIESRLYGEKPLDPLAR